MFYGTGLVATIEKLNEQGKRDTVFIVSLFCRYFTFKSTTIKENDRKSAVLNQKSCQWQS